MSNVPSNLVPTRITELPEYTGTSQAGYLPYALGGDTYKVQFATVAATSVVPPTRSITAGTGLSGGGDFTADRTISVTPGGIGATQLDTTGVVAGAYGDASNIPTLTVDANGRVTSVTTSAVVALGYVPETRTLTAGTGLSGGGSLLANRTFSVNFSSATPEPLGTATAGVADVAAREDHVHPAVDLSDTNETQGALPLGRGGTGDALSPVAGAVVYSTGSKFALTDPGTAGQVLTSNGTGEPTWETPGAGAGTVTSVNVSGGTTGVTFTGGPITTSGTITMGGTLAVANGGTGQTTYTNGQLLIGNSTGNTLTKATLTAGSGISITNGAGSITIAATGGGSGTVTSVDASGGTTGLSFTGGPITTSGTLTLGGTLALANGGTGATTAAGARVAILPSLATNAGKVLAVNSGATDVEWISAGGTGTVTSVDVAGGTTGLTFTGGPVTASGTITMSGTLVVANGGTGATTASDARANLSAAVLGANGDITSMTGLTGGISTPDFIQFDTAATVTDAAGKLYYNNADQFKTLAFQMNGSAVQKIGEEQYYRIKCQGAITKGQVVSFAGTLGASGGLIGKAATGLTAEQSSYILGLAVETGANNDWIFVVSFGEIKGIDTTGGAETWVAGDVLYYNPAVTGGLTDTKPTTPNAIAIVAAVVYAHATNGILFVRPTYGSVLGGTDGNVQFGTLSGGDVIVYDSGDQRWENVAQSTLSVGTATNIAGGAANRIAYQTAAGTTSFISAPTVANTFLEWSGSAFQWSANPLGTVTSVDVSGGTTGLTTSGGPITGSGTITLAGTLAVANGGTGQTSYTDGQLLIGNTTGNTLTKATLTAGTGISVTNGSGSITVTNSAPDQTVALTGGGTTSITGTYPNFTITSNDQYTGTVTSVDVSGGTTGLTTSGGPVTGSGTITLAGTLAVANGGTGQTSYTDGQLLIGNSSGNTLTKATLTAGSGVTITNGNGSITIASTGGLSQAKATGLNFIFGL